MKGDLEDFGLAELLQVLALGRRSGVLEIRSESQTGRLTLQGGALVDAATDEGLSGEPAFFDLMHTVRGSFSFANGDPDTSGAGAGVTISRSLDALLIEASLGREQRSG